MRRLILLIAFGTLLVGCGGAPPGPDYPATITSLERSLRGEGTAVAAAQSESRALDRRLAALQTTATATPARGSPAATPTATQGIPAAAMTATGGLSSTAAISATAPLSPGLALGSGDCGALPAGAIDHEDAAGFIGSQATVQGRVVGVGRAKKAIFLNFHQPYAGYFSGVIFISAWKNFPGTFEDLYSGRCVRVSGEIKEYQGAPEIIISSPEQVEVLP
jgi:hypothetical protein